MCEGQVAVVAGFRGWAPTTDLTLGRGGSNLGGGEGRSVKADRLRYLYRGRRQSIDGPGASCRSAEAEEDRPSRKLLEMGRRAPRMRRCASVGASRVQVRTFVRRLSKTPVRGMATLGTRPGPLIVMRKRSLEQEVVTGIAYARMKRQISLRAWPTGPVRFGRDLRAARRDPHSMWT